MKNRKKVVTVIKLVAFGVILTGVTIFVSTVLKDKYNYLKYTSFYEEEAPFDVLFFGSSRMLDGVYPMELWDDYGITSYNMAQHSERLKITYWQMKNAFHYNKPEVAVVDVSLFWGGKIGKNDAEALSYLHKSVDHMPLTFLKYNALRDITEEGVDITEFLFPIAIYHNRWNELEKNDFYQIPSGQAGAESRIKVIPYDSVEWSNHEIPDASQVDVADLDRMIELCKAEEVQLVFTVMPSLETSANPNVCGVINYMETYASECGVPFINLAKEPTLFNYKTDFCDTSHVNPSGAKKATKYIGDFLAEHYDFADEKNGKTLKQWEKSAADYMGIKKIQFLTEKEAENVLCYLMLLNDNDYDYTIELLNEECIETLGIKEILAELGMENVQISEAEGDISIRVTVYTENGEVFDEAEF